MTLSDPQFSSSSLRDSPFVRNMWYVAAWSHEVGAGGPVGRIVIGEPIVLFRRTDGAIVVLEDRCPHRHAPLSMGRVEGDGIRCMYHGLTFDMNGVCTSVPAVAAIPPGTCARAFPAQERWNWIWVWMGDPAAADPAQIPDAFGLDDPEWVMRADALDYAADYQLLHDNLCDLSHLDFVHEKTLGLASGSEWSNDFPQIRSLPDGLLIERWFLNNRRKLGSDVELVDTWSSYRFVLPGMFVLSTQSFLPGTAAASAFAAPSATPLFRRRDQQIVTPIAPGRSRYFYATGLHVSSAAPRHIDGIFAVVNASFAEDKQIIEGQQRIWDATPSDRRKTFLPQDKAPFQFRKLIERRLVAERAESNVAVGVAGARS